MRTKGIDISRAQEQFDFTAAVSAGVKFVIIRAGIRTDEDTYFRRNIEQCRNLGIDFGCYWYVTATDTAELDWQIYAGVMVIGDEKPSYPVISDMEEQRQIDNLTSKDLILTPEYSINEVTMAGVMMYMGWPYYAWSAGYDTYGRAEIAKTIYSSTDENTVKSLVKQEKITYILFEDGMKFEETECREDVIAKAFHLVYQSEDGRIRIYETSNS